MGEMGLYTIPMPFAYIMCTLSGGKYIIYPSFHVYFYDVVRCDCLLT